jgi:HSP20 family protein
MSKPRLSRHVPISNGASDLILGAEMLMEQLAVGSWAPNVDIYETNDLVSVCVELPGVESGDIRISFQDGILRLRGVKRQARTSHRLLCFYCLERRYGKFDRLIPIDWVVEAGKARACLANGMLTILLPKLSERRGAEINIPVMEEE